VPLVLKAPAAQPNWLIPPPKKPTQNDFRRFLLGMRDSAHSLGDKIAANQISPRQFGEDLYSLLRQGHSDAWKLGRNRAGDFTDNPFMDALTGRSVADSESDWILGFVQRISDGVYLTEDGEWREKLFNSHLNLYVAKARGTANEAFTESSPAESTFDWILGAVEEHCEECPLYASMSPWLKDEIITNPGQGETPCLCITSGGSMVQTINGPVPIAEIVVGDLVLTHKGRYMPVTDVHRNKPHGHIGAVLTTENGAKIGCTSEHRWFTKDGWKSATTIKDYRLSVYTTGSNEDLYEVQKEVRRPIKTDTLHGVLQGLRMREIQGLSSEALQVLRNVAFGQSSVGERRSNSRSSQTGRACAAENVRAFDTRRIRDDEAAGWAQVCVLLDSRRQEEVHLPIPMDLDHGQWPDPDRNGNPPHQRRLHGRPFGKSSNDERRRPSANALAERTGREYGSRSWVQDWQGRDCLPDLWQDVRGFQEQQADVLLEGLLPQNVTLYDITVAVDHSFVIEGVVSHNSNCKCHWRRSDGQTSFKPVSLAA